MNRRTFLKTMAMISATQLLPMLSAQAGKAAERKILVTVQLSGGNDGLNMLIPFNEGRYYKARPQLAIKAEDVLHLDDNVGFHPVMPGLHKLFKDGNVAVIQAVGYPRPNRSHFRSMEIWQTAQPDRLGDTGWLGRYLDQTRDAKNAFVALNLDPALPKTLCGAKKDAISVTGLNEFAFRGDPKNQQSRKAQQKAFEELNANFKLDRPHLDLIREASIEAVRGSDRMKAIVDRYQSNISYPGGNLGNRLKFVAQLITGGLGSSAYNVSFEGFDTHTNQGRSQESLLKQLSEALSAFYDDLKSHDMDKQVMVLVFSEFGRRVAENGSKGTDHGTAGPMLVLGHSVKGGVYGDAPKLDDLDDGDLKHKIDFRSVYATVLDGWLAADSKEILAGKYDNLGFV